MQINTKSIISISEANQNFSKAVKVVDKYGQAVIMKNNKPRYIINEFDSNPFLFFSEDEKIMMIALMLLRKHRKAFEELAKWLNSIKKKLYFFTNLS